MLVSGINRLPPLSSLSSSLRARFLLLLGSSRTLPSRSFEADTRALDAFFSPRSFFLASIVSEGGEVSSRLEYNKAASIGGR